MEVNVENLDPLDRIPSRYGVYIVLVTAVVFQIINQITQRVGYPAAVEKSDVWKWRNLFISWIHAVIVGTWDLSCLLLYPELMDDLIEYQNLYIYAMIAVSTGYFVHDFIDLTANGKLFSSWEIIMHHLAVAGMFLYNLLTSRCIGYNVIALLCEVNTIFLHSRKLLQMQGLSFNHWLYQTASYMNLFTFLSCRFVALTWIVYGMYTLGDQVSPAYFYTLAVAMFVMWVINVILFWRLLRNDVLRKFFTSSKKKSSTSLSSGDNCHHNNHMPLIAGRESALA